MINNEAMGLRIRQAREALELSRQQLAELVALSEYYIGQIERGERQMSLAVLVNIASCLHLSIDYIIFGSPHNLEYIQENSIEYATNKNDLLGEINGLVSRCSFQEQELILKLIKTIMPYLK